MELDQTDHDLLALLRQDARTTLSQLSRKLGLARSTVQSRLQRLERNGTIDGYTVRLGATLTQRRVLAHALISIEPRSQVEIEARLKQMPLVTALYSVSGSVDLLAHLAASSTAELDDGLDQMRALPGIRSTQTSIILSTRFER